MISFTSFKHLKKKKIPLFHKIKLVSTFTSFLQKQALYKLGTLSIKNAYRKHPLYIQN